MQPTATTTHSARNFAALLLLAALALPLVGQAAGGALVLENGSGRLPAASLDMDLEMVVRGPLARVRLTQHFRNDSNDWMEGVYEFPLPDEAAVDGLEMRIGDRVIQGEVREKQEAKRIYRDAKNSGHHASLVTQVSPDLFTTRAANIPPGETIEVTLTYVQPASWRDGAFTLRFPMTFTPRFDPHGGGGDEVAKVLSSAAPAGNPAPNLALDVWMDPGVPLDELKSLYHPVKISDQQGWKHLTLDRGTVPADRDFVLRWRPHAGGKPRVAAFSEISGDESFAMLMLVPPDPVQLDATPRDVTFVIDTSGSMHGASIEQAVTALADALDRLNPRDRFNVIRFSDRTEGLFPYPVPADTNNINRAVRWVSGLEAQGGTVMAPALKAALAGDTPHGWLRQVVFITDGAVGNERELFGLIHRNLGEARLFTVGIGAAPNAWFMREAARFGRGSYTYIADLEEVDRRMDALFDRLSHPAMQDLCVDWPVSAEQYPNPLPDLYAGEPLVVYARLATLDGGVGVCGKRIDIDWREHADLSASHRQAGIAKLWARKKIESLMDARVRGADPGEVRDAVLAVALKHQLMSPYTALVAVDKTPARTAQALKQRRLAGGAPAGWTRTTGLPQTGLGIPLHALLGLLGLLLALAAWRLGREA